MATTTISASVVQDEKDTLKLVLNPMPPYKKAHGEYAAHLVVGTDYTSGDDVVLTFEGSDDIYSADFKTDALAIKGGAVADIGGGIIGKKITLSNVTTDLYCRVLCSI